MGVREQKGIVELVKQITSQGKKKPGFFQSALERSSLIGAMVLLIPILLMIAMDKRNDLLLLLILLFYFLIMLYQIAYCIPILREFLKPTETAISYLIKEMDENEPTLHLLDSYHLKDICIVKKVLENKIEHISDGAYFFLGKLSSLGIVPTAIAMYLAYHEIASKQFPLNIGLILTALLAGLYLGSVAIHRVKIRYSDMIRVLNISELRVTEIQSEEKA